RVLEPKLARERQMRVIDRSQTRDTPWDPSVGNHRVHVGNSRRGPHLGSGHLWPRQQTEHMIAIASSHTAVAPLASRGPSTYGSRLGSLGASRRSPSCAKRRDDGFSCGTSLRPPLAPPSPTRYSLFATRYSLLAIRHSLLPIHH